MDPAKTYPAKTTSTSLGTGAILLWALVLSGCGGSDNLARVSGTVTLDRQPLPDAFIVFVPKEGGTPSYGRTDSDGYYEMQFSDSQSGAWIGESTVEISTYNEITPDEVIPEKVPASYNKNTTLTRTVEPGENVYNFDLKSVP